MSAEAVEPRPRFGGFSLGGLQLALPMEVLREVMPLQGLAPLPCPGTAVLGGVDLRGVQVPVLDLRCVLSLPAPELVSPSVIVMVHHGRILGLLADGVSGIFEAGTRPPLLMSAQDPVAAIYAGTVQRGDTGQSVSILSPQALAALPTVPWVQDPEPERQRTTSADAIDMQAQAGTGRRQLMLLRCGSLRMAIDALAVHGTLAHPQIEPSVLAQGLCRGVVSHGGHTMAALDLQALCGFGDRSLHTPAQAFVMRNGQGFAAMLIDEVLDIVGHDPARLQALPPFMLPRPDLFEGCLSAIEGHAADGQGHEGPVLLLHAASLASSPEAAGAMATNTGPAADAGTAVGARLDARELVSTTSVLTAPGRNLITFDLQSEAAVPIDDVQEILPFQRTTPLPVKHGHVIGMLCDRGRTIPVVCLSQLLLNRPLEQPTAAASVLVVEAGSSLVGFAVPSLKAIERTDWEPEVRALAHATNSGHPAWPPRQLARVGQGHEERMLPVLHLPSLALALQQQAGA